MNLNENELIDNWNVFLGYIKDHISEPRKQQLLNFYTKYEERFILLPASHKSQFHNCFPGGYVEHVNRVVVAALKINQLWSGFGAKLSHTVEEVVFSALNHDLGKFGEFEHEAVIPNPSEWHIKNRGELYAFNTQLDYMTVPDRGLWLLTQLGISVSKNEYLAIKLHDGLYDESNKSYLMNRMPETRLRTSLPHIIHQADLLAAYIEFEREWSDKLKTSSSVEVSKPIKVNNVTAVVDVQNDSLKKAMALFFE